MPNMIYVPTIVQLEFVEVALHANSSSSIYICKTVFLDARRLAGNKDPI
jgi:hypothetical protein